MKLALTNAGHRRAISILESARNGAMVSRAFDDPAHRLHSSLYEIWAETPEQRDLVSRGYAELLPDTADTRDIARRIRRNPIENLRKVVVEFTTRCDFSCAHCYNAGVRRVTETRLDTLSDALDTFAGIGVREFAFIGGEVSKYGDGWLEIAAGLRRKGAGIVGLVSNGWFLGERNFKAAGRLYADDLEYLADLEKHGVTHVSFSIDGRGKAHDESRGVPGLYKRVTAGFRKVRDAGLQPRVALLARDGENLEAHMRKLSPMLYSDGSGSIWFDQTNIVSNLIDIGNAAMSGGPVPYGIRDTPSGLLRCAGFYRPAPHITIKANGELATCRLADAGEGYGNIHDRPLVDILNSMQDSFIYRLHAGRRIGDYTRLIDPELFGRRFSHLCALRAVATMLATRMHDQGVEPDDADGVARINREVAAVTGHVAP